MLTAQGNPLHRTSDERLEEVSQLYTNQPDNHPPLTLYSAFDIEIPLELDWFAESIKNHLQTFHVQAITSTEGMLSDMDVEILQNTWKTQYETMERKVKLINRVVSKSQREMNRLFAKVLRIQLEMSYMRSSRGKQSCPESSHPPDSVCFELKKKANEDVILYV